MDHITVDPTRMVQTLDGFANQVVVCDANGIALGFFLPLVDRIPA